MFSVISTKVLPKQFNMWRLMSTNRVSETIKMMNFTMSVDEDKVEAIVHTDGLQLADYDPKTKNPKPHSLLNLVQATSVFAHYAPLDTSGTTFRDYATATSGRTTFTLTSRIDVCETMYDFNVCKSPLDVAINGGFIGKSSTSFTATIYSKNGIKLLSNATMLVCIDAMTRKPVPYPEWWKEKYAASATKHESLNFVKLTLPDDALKYTIRVLGSDLDFHKHTSWMNISRFAEDAIYHFVSRGQLKHLSVSDVRRLRTMELLYGGESFEGDYLDVFVWQLGQEKGAIWAQIYKDSTFIFQGHFQYFSE